jgi:hypothetical protein
MSAKKLSADEYIEPKLYFRNAREIKISQDPCRARQPVPVLGVNPPTMEKDMQSADSFLQRPGSRPDHQRAKGAMDYRLLIKRLSMPADFFPPARLVHEGVVATAITRADLYVRGRLTRRGSRTPRNSEGSWMDRGLSTGYRATG